MVEVERPVVDVERPKVDVERPKVDVERPVVPRPVVDRNEILYTRTNRAITTLAYDGDSRRLVKAFDNKLGDGGVKRDEYVFDGGPYQPV